MYRVVIVEDEPLIREGLVKTMPWADFDCCVVAEAADGVVAEEVIMHLQPDIVITDIQMPGINGIQLIQRLKAIAKSEFIIISGFDKFEFAQKALNLGVNAYLLKPIDEFQLETAIRNTVATIRLKENASRHDAKAQALLHTESDGKERYLEKASVIMENRCAEDLTLKTVAGELYISESYLAKLFKSYSEYTFLEKLTLYRIKKAVRYLKATDMRIYEIAVATGYKDARYFSGVFKKIVGTTPFEFRNGYSLPTSHILYKL